MVISVDIFAVLLRCFESSIRNLIISGITDNVIKFLRFSVILGMFRYVLSVTDDYAKDGGPEVVCHLCSFYQDPFWW